MTTINALFGIYPREIGIPWHKNFYRKVVTCKRDFHRYIDTINGVASCFVSVYDINNKVTVDKVIFDLDAENLDDALNDAKEIIKRVSDIPHFTLFSGRKGFHIYVLLKPIKMRRDVAGLYVKELQNKISSGLKTVDTHLIGNISAMIRVPNTLNHGRYCTFLLPEFMQWDMEQVLQWSTEPHEPDFDYTWEYKSIDELVSDISVNKQTGSEDEFKDIEVKGVPTNKVLYQIIRPCIMEEMVRPVRGERGAKHIARMDLVSELMYLAFTPSQIFQVFKNFNMPDFDEDVTKYQIKKLFESKLKPYGCTKLMKELPCTQCGWKYWW